MTEQKTKTKRITMGIHFNGPLWERLKRAIELAYPLTDGLRVGRPSKSAIVRALIVRWIEEVEAANAD